MLDTLRRRSAAARVQAAAQAASARAEVLALVRSRLPVGGRAWLIGSLAWGEFGSNSDIGLVFDGVDAGRSVEIETAVARSIGKPVDILSLTDLPASFRARVEGEGMAIHGP
ncbi:MAG TPA: nucleotidyltransferase domain-containing protein [Polyangia bacterium]|nr:nucleotidyltransferase domain-containing protein [Polyangia bacterium]